MHTAEAILPNISRLTKKTGAYPIECSGITTLSSDPKYHQGIRQVYRLLNSIERANHSIINLRHVRSLTIGHERP